ncbi:Histone-lysine N-methyltransferase SETMAR [Eumeta japonica]|uniref:Histone-lysine N-methyltransferase SETMAR n=1 Tax=Eumeta variegata TaxID=151549 RepID=A0A4C1URY7_EUMVA|nr:Histone-lysine N-methyltransferase SETMAR [Eumeta japonica]
MEEHLPKTILFWVIFRGEEEETTTTRVVTDEMVEEVEKIVLADRRVKVRFMAEETKISTERRGIRTSKNCKKCPFHQDNASAHRSAVAMAAIRDADFEILERPPYSPNLTPSDFYLLLRFKEYLKRQRFEDDEPVVAVIQEF